MANHERAERQPLSLFGSDAVWADQGVPGSRGRWTVLTSRPAQADRDLKAALVLASHRGSGDPLLEAFTLPLADAFV